MTDKQSATERIGGKSRRTFLAGAGAAGLASLAGCTAFLESAAETDATIATVAVESDEDGEYYHPTEDNIESGVYSPLTRPLFIYVNHASLEEKPDTLAAFVQHYFEGQHDFSRDTGYYAATDEVRDENKAEFQAVLDDLGIEPDEDAVDDDIDCSGSNTVAPVTDAAGESFEAEYPDANVYVDPEGTGAGFEAFAEGDSDVQSASRKIMDEEAELAEENGVEYSSYEIGWDGLSVVKHGENDWMEEVSLDELHAIWQYESDVEMWSDLDDDYPDEEIELWARDSDSGTFDYFTEEINGEVGSIRTDYSAHTHTDSIMEGVADNQYAFGWGGVGYFQELGGEPGEDEFDVEDADDGDEADE
ncbi:ABC transporter periplasmic phosphate-binding protein [Natronococcus amylolyticus DSM 10524]|uniref:ABC transporter periplasmic phosphate-binding protein n=1 Tax=Natronococcus amylolyticus DSM 10524 TaxID=1227497 RepID=L9WWQ0_9EURY|nr:substrate-binding domain-containing protein [Natronococcus amylolyticus]ELY53909.1 ABC transporter periplasmic phosphate-binding protein [Natronococcus amylolyticus DSM 10524]